MKKLIMVSAFVLLLIPNIQAAGIVGNQASQATDLGTATKIFIGMLRNGCLNPNWFINLNMLVMLLKNGGEIIMELDHIAR